MYLNKNEDHIVIYRYNQLLEYLLLPTILPPQNIQDMMSFLVKNNHIDQVVVNYNSEQNIWLKIVGYKPKAILLKKHLHGCKTRSFTARKG